MLYVNSNFTDIFSNVVTTTTIGGLPKMHSIQIVQTFKKLVPDPSVTTLCILSSDGRQGPNVNHTCTYVLMQFINMLRVCTLVQN